MLKLDLLENATNSFEEAIEYFFRAKSKGETRHYKFSILLLAHSTELLLKEILRVKGHPLLIYSDLDKLNIERLPGAHTVNLESSLKRLGLIEVTLTPYVEDVIKKTYALRNKIQHFEVELSEEECSKIVSEVITVTKYLIEDILELQLNDYLEKEGIIEELGEIQSIHESYIALANDRIKKQGLTLYKYELFPEKSFKIPCSNCGEKYLTTNEDGLIKCVFCRKQYESTHDLFQSDENSYVSEFCVGELNKRRMSEKYKIERCKSCGADDCYYDERFDAWFCLNCFESQPSISCASCGEPSSDEIIGFYYDEDFNLEPEYICRECANTSSKYIEIR
ncbi:MULTISPECIES: hypothetical protein [unclassified Exiguobacterium]|uniref:hypothetical protein n=1 Tax=unclassified Exiguobacterium TaxID=2644629 RepID=UPI001BE6F9D5|nr:MULTISPECIES: hypothetical protein [unclassified Exiguobacterium]